MIDAIEPLREPDYTGENRCLPCTVLNAAIAAALAGGVGAAAAARHGTLPGTLLATVLLVAFAAVIYLQGYLVPGTPRLTRAYLPDRVLGWFGKAPSAGNGPGEGAVDVERVLEQAGAVTEPEREDDLRLTEGFHAAWRDRIADLRERESVGGDLAAVLGVDPNRLLLKEFDGIFVAYLDARDNRVGEWESRAACLADVAAANELRTRYDGWGDLGADERGAVLNSLRVFLQRCPACDGAVTVDEEVVASCCRSVDVLAGTCRGCGARVFEVEHPGNG